MVKRAKRSIIRAKQPGLVQIDYRIDKDPKISRCLADEPTVVRRLL